MVNMYLELNHVIYRANPVVSCGKIMFYLFFNQMKVKISTLRLL